MNIGNIIRRVSLSTLGLIFPVAVTLGAVLIPATNAYAAGCSHEIFAWDETLEPSCSRTGTKVKICQDCGATLKTETIGKTSHKAKWQTTRKATCTRNGLRSKICKDCGEVIETEYIPLKEHSYKWVVTKKATCADAGSRQQQCKNCNKTGQRESLPATGKHKYDKWSAKINVTGRALKVYEERKCKNCKRNAQTVAGATTSFASLHGAESYYYKLTPGSGKIVILCADCHQSVTGVVSGSSVKFTRPRKDNAKPTSKGWIAVH